MKFNATLSLTSAAELREVVGVILNQTVGISNSEYSKFEIF